MSSLNQQDKFAIFWGGGLGDLLVLRPLLIALTNTVADAPYFFTTSTHLSDLFSAFDLKVNLHVLPQSPAAAMRVFRSLGIRFDWLYLGPYPRMKSRMLAHAIRPHRIWSVVHPETNMFVGEQVLADIAALGLGGPEAIHLPYGGDWGNATQHGDTGNRYLVLHPGAKERWETTRWPDAAWTDLIRNMLTELPMDLKLVGVKSERTHLEMLASVLPPSIRSRISILTDNGLDEVAATIRASEGVICHNSGIMHLSAMLRKPTLAVTGSSALYWRPPYPHVKNITSGACNLACNQYKCPVPFFRAKCIRTLEPGKVMDVVIDLFGPA